MVYSFHYLRAIMQTKKRCITILSCLVAGSVLALFSGCSETRYDNTVLTYRNHDSTAVNGSVTKHYTIGQDSAATAEYNYRTGSRPPITKAPESSAGADTAAGSGQKSTRHFVTLDATDVLFEFDKAVIRKQYYSELDKWASFFTNNPSVTADIYGHADSTGPKKYNQGLSERRAKAICNYLVGQGIGAERLHPVGFGETQPIAPNTTKEGRQKNRRVELNLK